MKLAKMSMVAALLLGANAYAIDNVKVNGDARLYYSTEDRSTTGVTNTPDMFDKDASAGQAALHLGLTADLTEGISAGTTMIALSTLGLENNLVSNVWENQNANHSSDYWFSEAWIAGTAGKTTAKVGRMALDTPLAFTETWSIAENTFEAAVLINQDIADTTLVGAWIGSSNAGTLGFGSTGFAGVVAQPSIGNGDSRFSTFHNSGAYTIGAINNSFAPLTINAWYYEAPSTASAIWASADLDMDGILAGVQYATFDPAATGSKDGDAVAAMLGYAMKDVMTIKAAYSTVDEDQDAGFNLAGQQSKLYTEMWWNYGRVGSAGADSMKVSVEGAAMGVDLFAGYHMSDIDVAGTANDLEVSEITVTAGKDFGPLNASVALIFDELDYGVGAGDADTDATTLQVYLTYNF